MAPQTFLPEQWMFAVGCGQRMIQATASSLKRGLTRRSLVPRGRAGEVASSNGSRTHYFFRGIMLKVAPNRSRPSKTEKRKANLARRDFHLIGIEKAAVLIIVIVTIVIVVAAVAGLFGSPTAVIVVALIVSVLCLGVGGTVAVTSTA